MSIEGGPRFGDGAQEASPEARAEFVAAQRVGTFHAFERGRALGISDAELEAYVRGVVATCVASGEQDRAARILRSTGIGNDAEIAALEAAAPAIEAESMPEELVLRADATFTDLRDALARRPEFASAFRTEIAAFMPPDAATVFFGHVDSGADGRVADALTAAGFSVDEAAAYFFIRFE